MRKLSQQVRIQDCETGGCPVVVATLNLTRQARTTGLNFPVRPGPWGLISRWLFTVLYFHLMTSNIS